ncbi:MAG: hypothetical protein OEY89_15765 [Gammaproteobacteria bacterium]|nr:hypothetical protein [Gammaproteobacteria bacterium]
MRKLRIISLMFVIAISVLNPGMANSGQEEKDIVVYSGYYVREGNEGKTAELSGKSHYVKFYPGNKVVRLYIPYPYSMSLSPDVIRKVFSTASKKSSNSAFIRDKFDLLEQPIVAHIDTFRRVNGEIQYDCGNSAPCKIIFMDNSISTIQKAIVGEHIIKFDYVKE